MGKLLLLTPGAVSAAFGMFVASALLRPHLSWRRGVELMLVGQFVTRVAACDALTGAGAAIPAVSVLGHKMLPQYVDLAGAAAGAAVFCTCAALKDALVDLLGEGEGVGPPKKGGSRRRA